MKQLIILSILFISQSLIAQVTIKGPECVLPSSTYEYQFELPAGTSASMQVCVKGGTIVGSATDCINGNAMRSVRVNWKDTETNGSITLTGAGQGSKNVSITPALKSGTINTASITQTIEYNKAPAMINCSAAKGGGCSSVFVYQWQKSLDNVSWTTIEGATNQNLNSPATLQETTFFRRRVTNTVSNAIGYSDLATVYVNPENRN